MSERDPFTFRTYAEACNRLRDAIDQGTELRITLKEFPGSYDPYRLTFVGRGTIERVWTGWLLHCKGCGGLRSSLYGPGPIDLTFEWLDDNWPLLQIEPGWSPT